MNSESSPNNRLPRVARDLLPAIRRGYVSLLDVFGRYVRPPSQAVSVVETIPFESYPCPTGGAQLWWATSSSF